MNDSQNRDVEVFTEALQLPPAQRAAYLAQACGGDDELRRKVEALLEGHDRIGDFLEQSPQTILPRARPEISAGEKPGERIGHYKLLQQIGEGGCGVVFMAEQQEPVRRRVALKIIKPGMDTKSVIARFEAERQALALMDHPNIAKIFDAGATGSGRPYFVMELVRGIKITEYCDQGSLTTQDRLKLFVQVCQAVQHAHQKGIIHRDIKPSNILVTRTEEGAALPVVIDFGIAKATTNQQLTDKTLFTAFEMLIGTPAYMSPEQAALTSVDVDTRTDIYSLGVLLYELLTGSTPFDTGELLKAGLDEIRRVIREQDPVRPSTRLSKLTDAELTTVAQRQQSEPPLLIRAVRGDLDWIVMQALEKDRTRRYATANGLALDVQRFLANETISARPPGTVYKLQKAVQRHKLLFLGVGVILLLMMTSLIVVSTLLTKERRSRRETEAASVKSRQVTKFLEDMLQGVGPSAALGQDTALLRGILDRTAERVGLEMTNQPAVEAELRNVIGTLYRRIGSYSRAEEMHRVALEIRRKLFGPEDPWVAESLNELGLELQTQKKLAEAESAFTEALTIRRRRFGSGHADTATSMNDLGAVYRDQGRLNEGEALAREALGIRERLFGRKNLDTVDSLRNLSISLGAQSQWIESEKMAREVLETRRELLGPDHPWIAWALNDVAWAVSGAGRLEEAETLQREALAIRRKLLPEEHPDVATSLQLVGDSMRKRGNLKEALSVLSAALSIQHKLLGEGDVASIATLRSFGLTLGAEGKWPEAETVHRKALALWRERSGAESRQTLYAMSDVGLALENQRKWPEAETIYRQALALGRQIVGPQDGHTLHIMHRLGLTCEGQDKWTEAESIHREALAYWRNRSGEEDVQTLYAMRNLAATLEGAGKWSEAETVHQNSLVLWRKRERGGDQDVLYTLDRLQGALEAQRKWAEGETVVREALALRRKRHGDTHGDTLSTMHRLGVMLEGAGKWREAETVHRDALALWRKKAGDEDPQTLYAIRNLAGTLEGEGKLAEAEGLYRGELAIWRKRVGDEDRQTFYTRRKLGAVLDEQGKWPEAETVYRESLGFSRKRPEGSGAVSDLERLVRALMAQKKFAEAERLLNEALTPAFVRQPASASLLVQRANLNGRQRQWSKAAADAALALELQPKDHYRYHTLAGLLAITRDRPAYERLCQRILTRFTNSTDYFVAERVAQDCLLLPGAGVDLELVDKLAQVAVTVGNGRASAYAQGCKAMSHYRLGHFREAAEWAEQAIATASLGPKPEAQGKAYAVLAMALWQLGQKDAARAMLSKGNAATPEARSAGESEDIGESWVAWLFARLSLDEAAALIRSDPAQPDGANQP